MWRVETAHVPEAGRVFLSREGGMVEGFNKTTGEPWRNHPPVTESPSGYGMTLRVGWGWLEKALRGSRDLLCRSSPVRIF